MDIKLDKKQQKAYDSYKESAIRRGYKFELTKNQFLHIINSNCSYCGQEPREYSDGLIRNGVDRVFNSKGYNHFNVTACCSTCNSMKSTLDYFEFVEKCNKITKQKENLRKLRSEFGDTSAEVMAFSFKFGKYLSPNQLFLCIKKGLLKKEDVKYNFKVALEDFKEEFKITKDSLRRDGMKLKDISIETFKKSQMKLWKVANSPFDLQIEEMRQIKSFESSTSIKRIKKFIKKKKSHNKQEFITDHGLSKEDLMNLKPF